MSAPSAASAVPAGENSLWNPDLAPVPPADRTWGTWNFAALWISMAACVPTYMLASSLIAGGMNWWQAILTIFLANVIVLIPMVLNAHAGTKYGIPFPVYCRASFGTLGANVPAILRALVACGWFGIQAWIGGEAIHKILSVLYPALTADPKIALLGISLSQAICFLFFWLINMWVIHRGIDCIRWLLIIKAPLLILLGLLFVWWAYGAAGGLGSMLSQPSAFDPGQPKAGQFWRFFFPALTGMVGFWATLSLNIPDFSRYARSQKDQVLGQAIGLPPTMALYSFIGVAVTSAAVVIFKDADPKTLWDPVVVLTRIDHKPALIVAMLALCLATLATNIAANVVSPANDFANIAPRRISFRLGGYLTGIIGILIMPWHLMENAGRYLGWLVSYSALLGPIGGVLIADYFAFRHRLLNLEALYDAHGEYRFKSGFSFVALAALVLGILPSLPGFLVSVGAISQGAAPGFLVDLFNYAWFVGFALAFAAYVILRKFFPHS